MAVAKARTQRRQARERAASAITLDPL